MEALINMICELKITSGCKKLCKNSMVIRYSVLTYYREALDFLEKKVCILDTFLRESCIYLSRFSVIFLLT